jgi:hypothetical protein
MKRGRRPELRWCKIEGCNRPLEARGLCSTHYRRLRLWGDSRAERPVIKRLGGLGAVMASLFLLAQSIQASPFLVCDPYPAGADPNVTPTTFILKGLSANPIMTGAQINPDGTVQLHYDLATLGNGNFTVIADAVNTFGGVSPDSPPFVFTNGIPAPPSNLRIVP